jgi:predicted  nucleic acid-binding Zn-ribbon protein
MKVQGSSRMSKVKMRCITCGKWFQSANAKEVTCPDCTQKARREKLAAKNAASNTNKPVGASGQNAPAPVRPVLPKTKATTHSGTNQWLDRLNDVKIGQPEQAPTRPKLPPAPREDRSGPGKYQGPGSYREDRGPGGYREDRGPGGYRNDRGPGSYREGMRGPGGYREDRPGPYRVVGGSGLPETVGPRPRFGQEGKPRGPRPDKSPGGLRAAQKPKPKAKAPRPPVQPRPKKVKTPPPQPFAPTAEQVAQIEERYLELAQPAEFDGIRTQIANELGIPKKAVKKVVKELRERQNIPSWWETQTYKGPAEEKEKIKALYEPMLPVPPVGVHKTIAEQLGLKPGDVYQAIKAIRLEMNLPQYNDPTLHEGEPKQQRQSRPATTTDEPQPEPTQLAETAAAQTAAANQANEQPAQPVSVAETAQESVE